MLFWLFLTFVFVRLVTWRNVPNVRNYILWGIGSFFILISLASLLATAFSNTWPTVDVLIVSRQGETVLYQYEYNGNTYRSSNFNLFLGLATNDFPYTNYNYPVGDTYAAKVWPLRPSVAVLTWEFSSYAILGIIFFGTNVYDRRYLFRYLLAGLTITRFCGKTTPIV